MGIRSNYSKDRKEETMATGALASRIKHAVGDAVRRAEAEGSELFKVASWNGGKVVMVRLPGEKEWGMMEVVPDQTSEFLDGMEEMLKAKGFETVRDLPRRGEEVYVITSGARLI
jgi:hypothetical protein